MLTAIWQNQDISHGLQIGKDQEDSSQDANHGYHFNDIGFIDDILIFAETPEEMPTCKRGLHINKRHLALLPHSPTSPQKSPTYPQKSPTYLQKSPAKQQTTPVIFIQAENCVAAIEELETVFY